jgi:hypothetical protein
LSHLWSSFAVVYSYERPAWIVAIETLPMLIFVSYSSRDQELVENFCTEISLLGHNVSFEQKYPGSPFQWRQAFDSIADADVLVFIVTPNTVESYSRRVEYEHALALGKPIVAAQFAPADLSQLPEWMPDIVAYRPDDPASIAAFAEILNRQSVSITASRSEPFARLERCVSALREQIGSPQLTSSEVTFLVFNLQELLERRETYRAAVALYSRLAARIDPSDPLIEQIQTTSAQLQKSVAPRQLKPGMLQYILGILLIVGVIGIVFLVTRFINTSANNALPVVTSSDSTPTVRFVDAQVDETSEVVVSATNSTTQAPVVSPTRPTSAPSNLPPILTFTATVSPAPTEVSLVIQQSPTSIPTLIPASATFDLPSPTITYSHTALPPSPTVTNSHTPVPPSPTVTNSHTPLPPSPTPSPNVARTVLPSPTTTNTVTPTATSEPSLENAVPQRVYVGMTVENSPRGTLVTSTGPTAAASGVIAGDFVLAVDSRSVNSVADFSEAMKNRSVFSSVWLSLRRDNRIMLVLVTLGIEDFVLVMPATSPDMQ